MKKAMGLVGFGLLLVLVGLLSCAQVPVEKTIVTEGNLSALKGTWSGWTSFKGLASSSVLTNLEISNDTVPIQGTITLYNLPQGVANLFPNESLSLGNNFTLDFKNGLISDKGTIIAESGKNSLELAYYAGEKPRVDGWFLYYSANGTMTLTKK